MPWQRMDRAIPPPPLCTFMACHMISFTSTFTVTLERVKYTVILQYTCYAKVPTSPKKKTITVCNLSDI